MDDHHQDVCQHCGKRGHLPRCGRCKMVRYCGAECQRADWSTHKPHCVRDKLPEMKPQMEQFLVSGDAARTAGNLPPEVDSELTRRGVESGAYSDTRVDLGHGVTLGMSRDGYWIRIRGVEPDLIQLGKPMGMVVVSNAIEEVMQRYKLPIKGRDACLKLMEATARVMNASKKTK